ncbi:MAG TPA: cytochrome c maturation protein CcmE [Thermoanaerobaculia bacterium]|jgi:cytochrome c-type biogenesis protein CcmE|nr:cytochrome c maturation protein CcmE [Thermoanaerobaculia bacterium]
MKRRALYVAGAALLLAFAGFAFTSFQETLTPYVSFDQARSLDHNLQVAGGLVKKSSSYGDGALSFTLREPATGRTLRVRYRGVKPANFEEAISVVAIGRYQKGEAVLEADKLLVKCPSKYQGVSEAEMRKYS